MCIKGPVQAVIDGILAEKILKPFDAYILDMYMQ